MEDLSRGSAEVDARRAHPTSFQAAKELAPYTHPKLTSIESRTGGRTHEDRLREAQRPLSDDEPAEGRDAHRGVIEMKMKGVALPCALFWRVPATSDQTSA